MISILNIYTFSRLHFEGLFELLFSFTTAFISILLIVCKTSIDLCFFSIFIIPCLLCNSHLYIIILLYCDVVLIDDSSELGSVKIESFECNNSICAHLVLSDLHSTISKFLAR